MMALHLFMFFTAEFVFSVAIKCPCVVTLLLARLEIVTEVLLKIQVCLSDIFVITVHTNYTFVM
jgi:hypothetical protein